MNRAFHWLDPRGAKQRLLYAVLAGVSAYLLSPSSYAWLTRTLIGGDVGGAMLLAFAMSIILGADEAETQRRAASADPGSPATASERPGAGSVLNTRAKAGRRSSASSKLGSDT